MDFASEILKLTNQEIEINEGDYVKGGLLYCGTCHKPKQTTITFLGKDKVVNCICDCRKRELEERDKKAEQEDKMARVNRHRSNGFSSNRLKECTFENDNNGNTELTKLAKVYVRDFAEFKKDGKGLLFWGTNGTGKTYMASAIANALIDKCIPCVVTNFSRISNLRQENFKKVQEYIDSFNNFDLMVIDDLGAERNSEYMREIVFDIIDNRNAAKLPIIITTNLHINELKKATNTDLMRIYDRVLQMCFPFEVKGKSLRKQEAIDTYADMRKRLELDERGEKK